MKMQFFAFALLAIATVFGNEEKRICEPGALTKVECNDCICSKDGTSQACTMMFCSPQNLESYVERRRRQATNENGQTDLQTNLQEKRICEPGTLTKVDCNDCICSKDGTSQACTMMFCSPQNLESYVERRRRQATDENGQTDLQTNVQEKKICEPGVTSKVDCNSCICSKDGTFQACTLMLCLPVDSFNVTSQLETSENVEKTIEANLQNPDQVTSNSSVLRRKRQVSHDRPCVAGKRFKVYCNTCTCGSDGFSVACTRMQCPEGVYNEDGTLKNL